LTRANHGEDLSIEFGVSVIFMIIHLEFISGFIYFKFGFGQLELVEETNDGGLEDCVSDLVDVVVVEWCGNITFLRILAFIGDDSNFRLASGDKEVHLSP